MFVGRIFWGLFYARLCLTLLLRLIYGKNFDCQTNGKYFLLNPFDNEKLDASKILKAARQFYSTLFCNKLWKHSSGS